MIFVDRPELETWCPDFSSSGQSDPTWTRLRSGSLVLANSLEAPEWDTNPVQVIVCEACGHPQCATGGYVHVSRTPRHVVWTAPQIDQSDSFERDEYQAAYSIRQGAIVLLRTEQWDAWSKGRKGMPLSADLTQLNGRGLADAWLLSMPSANRAPTLEELPEVVRERAVASDSLEVGETSEVLAELVGELIECRDRTLSGDFVRLPGRRAETVYFEAPIGDEWPAIQLGSGPPELAFSHEWVFRRSFRL